MSEGVNFKEYLINHPLAFEILSILVQKEKVSSTFLAKELGRSISTVYDSLSDMKKKGILKSKKKGVKTYFYPVNKLELKQHLENKEVQRSFAKTVPKLRRPSISLRRIFETELAEELKKRIVVSRHKKLETFTRKTIVDFLFKTASGDVVCIDVKRISHKFPIYGVYRELGRIIDLTKGPAEIKNLLLVLLLPSKKIDFDEWKYKKLIRSLSTDKTKLEVIARRVDNEDLLNPSFIEELAEQIVIYTKTF